MRYAQNLAEYEQGIAEGIIDENVFVIVLDEKVAKFKGQTFDWSGGGSGNGGDFEVRTVYPTKQTVLEEETFDITDEERAYNMETLSKTLSGKTVFCKVGEAILFPTISMSGAVTEATYSTVVVLYGSLASYSLTITSDGDAEVAIAEVTTGGGGGSDIVVDSAMSPTSTNPVQNKVVKQYVDDAETKSKKYTDDKIAQIETGGGISLENADKRYIRKVVDNFDSDLTFAVADGIVGTDDEYYFIPAKAPSTALDSQILATKADIPEIDTSALATKEEVQTAVSGLTSVIIGNERIHAAALNDLNSRIVYLESIISTLNNN